VSESTTKLETVGYNTRQNVPQTCPTNYKVKVLNMGLSAASRRAPATLCILAVHDANLRPEGRAKRVELDPTVARSSNTKPKLHRLF